MAQFNLSSILQNAIVFQDVELLPIAGDYNITKENFVENLNSENIIINLSKKEIYFIIDSEKNVAVKIGQVYNQSMSGVIMHSHEIEEDDDEDE